MDPAAENSRENRIQMLEEGVKRAIWSVGFVGLVLFLALT